MLRYKEIKRQLIDIISEMQIGDCIPPRTRLSRKLDTSRATIDKAIHELVEEGVLVSRTGSGTYVSRKLEGMKMHVENWALLIPNISSGIYSKMAYGVEQVARERGVNLIFCSFGQDLEKQNEYIQRLMINRISGFIIVPAVTHNVQENIVTYSSLLHAHIPFVFCNRDVEGIPAPVIKSNDFYGGYIGTKYLLERNYRKIVYLAPQRYRTSCERCQGYISALLEKGVEIDRSQILISERDTPQMSAEALLRKIEQGDEIDAVFCFDDETALHAARALQAKGIRIPQQIALIGYNNTDVCHTTEPQLTSIAYKSEDIGRMAARVLSKMIDGHEVPEFSYYLVNPVIIERGSC